MTTLFDDTQMYILTENSTSLHYVRISFTIANRQSISDSSLLEKIQQHVFWKADCFFLILLINFICAVVFSAMNRTGFVLTNFTVFFCGLKCFSSVTMMIPCCQKMAYTRKRKKKKKYLRMGNSNMINEFSWLQLCFFLSFIH